MKSCQQLVHNFLYSALSPNKCQWIMGINQLACLTLWKFHLTSSMTSSNDTCSSYSLLLHLYFCFINAMTLCCVLITCSTIKFPANLHLFDKHLQIIMQCSHVSCYKLHYTVCNGTRSLFTQPTLCPKNAPGLTCCTWPKLNHLQNSSSATKVILI